MTDYYERAGLIEPLEALGFHLVGYGCTTCIGNSGPLPPEISAAVEEGDLAVCVGAVGQPQLRGSHQPGRASMNYLASPPLCVAYALAGSMDVDLYSDPLGEDADGEPVYLRDLWPTQEEVHRTVEQAVQSDMFRASYAEVFDGDESWNGLETPGRRPLRVGPDSDLRAPPALLRGHARRRPSRCATSTARACSRCSATASPPTTSRRPASIRRDSPAGPLPVEHGVVARATSTPTARGAATTR